MNNNDAKRLLKLPHWASNTTKLFWYTEHFTHDGMLSLWVPPRTRKRDFTYGGAKT